MKLPVWLLQTFLVAALSLILGVEGWILNAVVDLKVEVAALKTAVNNNQETHIAQK